MKLDWLNGMPRVATVLCFILELNIQNASDRLKSKRK